MESTNILLTPFNLFDWKEYMVIQLRSKGLYIVTMGTEVDPNSVVEKAKYVNGFDEEYWLLCMNISRDIFFHVDILMTPVNSG